MDYKMTFESFDNYYPGTEDLEKNLYDLNKERKLARLLLEKFSQQSDSPHRSNESLATSSWKPLSKPRRHSVESLSKSSRTSLASELNEISWRLSEISTTFNEKYGDFEKINLRRSSSGESNTDNNLFPSYPNFENNSNVFIDPEVSRIVYSELSDRRMSDKFDDCASEVSFDDYCNKSWRSSIGLGRAKSPERNRKIHKLVSISSMESVDHIRESDFKVNAAKLINEDDTLKSMKKQCVSLTSIARVLEDNVSPQVVIDKLLQMKEWKKNSPVDVLLEEDNQSLKSVNIKNEDISKRYDHVVSQIEPKDKNVSCANLNLKSDETLFSIESEEVVTCVMDVSTTVEVVTNNQADQWLLITINLHQIQGNINNIELDIPKEIILVKPCESKYINISAKMKKLCKPIMINLHFEITNMITREKWNIFRLMCFVAEKLNVQITGSTESNELCFGDITADSTKVLPVTVSNKNNVELIVEIEILENKLEAFCIDPSTKSTEIILTSDHALKLLLKSQECFTVNVAFRGFNPTALKDEDFSIDRNLCSVASKLLIKITDGKSLIEVLKKEIHLVGRVGTIDIKSCDLVLPVKIAPNESKPFFLKNHGSIGTVLTPYIMCLDESSQNLSYKIDPNFTFTPEYFSIKASEKKCFFLTYTPTNLNEKPSDSYIKIKSSSGNFVCSYPILKMKSSILPNNYIENNRYLNRSSLLPYFSTSREQLPYESLSIGKHLLGRFSVANEVIPIRATHSSLNWGSVPAGSCEIKEFQIRNMSSGKLQLIANIEGSNSSFTFQSFKHSRKISMMIITLRDFETKSVSVVFEPQKSGAASGKIVFEFYTHKREKVHGRPSKVIQLSGYCGYAKLNIFDNLRDMNGQRWLFLNDIDKNKTFTAKMRLKNTGDLSCYTQIYLLPKLINADVHLNWSISPKEALLKPKEEISVSILFKPKKSDLDLVKKSNITIIGSLKIIHVDEPSRLRLRELYRKMIKLGQMKHKDDQFERVSSSFNTVFPGENTIKDLYLIQDSIQNFSELCQGLREEEIKLMIPFNNNKSVNDNDSEIESDMSEIMNETIIFHSIRDDVM